MSPQIDTPSPGGWLRLYGVRVAKALVIGGAGALLAVNVIQYGTQNLGQVEHYCEGALATTATKGGVAKSCRNPFQGTGAVVLDTDQGVYVTEAPYTVSKLDAGPAASATLSGSAVFDNLIISGQKRFLSTYGTGSSTFRSKGIVTVASGAYLNFVWGGTTSGATTTGKNPGAVRLKWFNCSDISSTVAC
jgi:hypothetical protein